MRRAPLILGGIALAGLIAFAEEPPPGERSKVNSCLSCHSEFDGELLEPTLHVEEDVHFKRGLACHDCHGGDPSAGLDGDPDEAHSAAEGFAGKPSRLDTPRFCARCHSDANLMKAFNPHARVDQWSEYRTSRHGRRLDSGDDSVAVCTDCHGAHGIREVDDPRSPVYPTNVAETCAACHADSERMGPHGLPTGQYREYRRSAHAAALYEKGDTSAPTCNDCHGSHGAVPPGVENVSNVCGSCHGREATLFREIEEKKDINVSACIQCMICHDNHAVLRPTDDMIGVGERSTCTACHAEGEPAYDAVARMGGAVVRLAGRLEEANALLDAAERAGMEVGPDRFALQKARDRLVEARVLAHSFDLERFLKVTAEGLEAADAGVAAGHRAFADLRFRRTGLALSLIVIAAVIVALWLKIRQIEARTAE
ncbi:MAG: hypothetical protein ACE5JH_02000 [Acidobacteriota bacterium]